MPAAPLYLAATPVRPVYIEDALIRSLVTMVAVPAAVCLAAFVLVMTLERLVIRPVTARCG